MPSALALYLENIEVFFKHEAKEGILGSSRHFVNAAEKGNLSSLGRIFNDFPLCYQYNEVDYFPLNNHVIDNFKQVCKEIIAQNVFKLTSDDSPNVSSPVAVTVTIEESLSALLECICAVIVDKQTKLIPAVIQLFKLEKLLASDHHPLDLQHEVIFQVIYSFYTQVINANLTHEFCQEHDLPIDQIDMFNKKCSELYLGEGKSATLFSEAYKQCILRFLYGDLVCADRVIIAEIMTLDRSTLIQIIQNDLESCIRVSDIGQLIEHHKLNWWFQRLDDYWVRQKLTLHEVIFESLPKEWQLKWKEPNCLLSDKVADSENHTQSLDADLSKILTSRFAMLFKVRDNQFLLNYLLNKLHQHKAVLLTGFKKTFKQYLPMMLIDGFLDDLQRELQTIRFNIDLLSQPFDIFIENLLNQSKQKSACIFLLRHCFPVFSKQLNVSPMLEQHQMTQAVADNNWDFVISLLINMKLTDLSVDELKLIHQQSDQLIQAFLIFLKQRQLTPAESIERINAVLENKNALSAALKTSSSAWLNWATAILDKKRKVSSLNALEDAKQNLLPANPIRLTL